MSKISRRDMLKTSAAVTLATPVSILLGQCKTNAFTPSGSEDYPRLLRHDMDETCIDLGSSVPNRSLSDRFEQMLIQAGKSRRLSVTVAGRITPIGDFDDRYSSWILLCERYGVNAIIERSNREPVFTLPLRVGQLDPAGIVYQITSRTG